MSISTKEKWDKANEWYQGIPSLDFIVVLLQIKVVQPRKQSPKTEKEIITHHLVEIQVKVLYI